MLPCERKLSPKQALTTEVLAVAMRNHFVYGILLFQFGFGISL